MESAHRQFLDLIPWYVNGTLADRERRTLEKHLQECLPCHAAFRDERRFRQALRAEPPATDPVASERGAAALLDRIERRESLHWYSGPVVRYGAAAAAGGFVVWLALAVSDRGPESDSAAPFATLSTPIETEGTQIDIVFTDDLNDAERAGLLAEIGGEIVSGPSQIGRYTIVLHDTTEADLMSVLDGLTGDARVRFAGRTFIEESGGADADVVGAATDGSGDGSREDSVSADPVPADGAAAGNGSATQRQAPAAVDTDPESR